MTCIVGWTDGVQMVMGADSLAASAWDVRVRRDPKLFRLAQQGGPSSLIGFTSSYRMGQLLMGLTLPSDLTADPFAWMVDQFIPAVRMRLKDGGYTKIENTREAGGTFLMAYRGRIFEVCDDFQVAENAAGFAAIGCGAAYALGALSVLDVATDPEGKLRVALGVAEALSGAVRGPMLIERVHLAES